MGQEIGDGHAGDQVGHGAEHECAHVACAAQQAVAHKEKAHQYVKDGDGFHVAEAVAHGAALGALVEEQAQQLGAEEIDDGP